MEELKSNFAKSSYEKSDKTCSMRHFALHFGLRNLNNWIKIHRNWSKSTLFHKILNYTKFFSRDNYKHVGFNWSRLFVDSPEHNHIFNLNLILMANLLYRSKV